MPNNPIVLGLDPGYDRIGWAVGRHTDKRQVEVIAFGCIQTDKKQLLTHRYQQLIKELSAVLQEYQPSEVAIESIFFSKSKKTALTVAESRGVIISCCLHHTNHILDYSPPTIKLAVTGNGAAPKAAVDKMVRLQTILPTQATTGKILDDAIDAVAILITHLSQQRLSKLTSSR